MVAHLDSSDDIFRRIDVKGGLSLEIQGLWRADNTEWLLPSPGHVTCDSAVTASSFTSSIHLCDLIDIC
jgi:hypothetical protein